MPHEKSLKYAWEPRNDNWFCLPPSVVLKILDHWGDVLICFLINTSARSHWLKNVALPVGPVLKFRDIPDCSNSAVWRASFYPWGVARVHSDWHDSLSSPGPIKVQSQFQLKKINQSMCFFASSALVFVFRLLPKCWRCKKLIRGLWNK